MKNKTIYQECINKTALFTLSLLALNSCAKENTDASILQSQEESTIATETTEETHPNSTPMIKPFSDKVVPLDQIEWLSSPKKLGTFRNTYFYLKDEAPYTKLVKDAEILTPKGNQIAKVNSKFKKLLNIEGSGKLLSGLVVNYAGTIDGTAAGSRYLPTVHEWGRGTGNCPLIPFRVIAVDRTIIPLGSVVYIKETNGMKLPDGSVHDGYWLAGDTGGAIKKDRIDIFTGKESWGSVLTKNKIKHLQALTISLVATPTAKSCKSQRAQ